ncbi:MAG: hypothetical protein AAFQ78_02795, partial [Bacteroidota bacterium]
APFYDPALTALDRSALQALKDGTTVPTGLSPLGDALVYVWTYFHDTPRKTIVNNLGYTILEERIKKSKDQPTPVTLRTYYTYDILGRELTSADPRLSQTAGLHNFEMTYSLVGEVLKTISVDAGTSWGLTNTLGNPIWGYDARQVTVTHTYDVLHRPTQVHVQKPTSAQDPLALNQIVEQMVYGDTPGAVTNPAQHNLRGQLYQHYDEAGLVTIPNYELAGGVLEQQRQFLKDYKQEVNWDDITPGAVAALLQASVYTEQAIYDAMGRVTKDTDADNNEVVPTYHPQSGRLQKVTLTPNDAPTSPVQVVTDITYNARNQREAISYGNATATAYTYDPKTYELTGVSTQKGTDPKLQDLTYVYDPVGNVVSKTDAAAPEVFYNNEQVNATMTYTYDSLYRLIEGTGREKVGSSPAAGNIPIIAPSPHAHNSTTLQNYLEKYTYGDATDAAKDGGNLRKTQHIATGNNYTRTMVVSDTSNRAVISTINGTGMPEPTPAEVNNYFYVHGNQVKTQQLHPLAWNYRDNLQKATVV